MSSLKRIVKMTFEPSEIENFKALFAENNDFIRNFEGCEHLELFQDINQKNIFFTYSFWKDEAALENYRNSDLFKRVWKNTKKMFSEKAQAWSVENV
ncbi:MAG TPA: antibiotic biosynthesis monooxygenase family protein [Salinimicrobium sp.]|nr:antibiotic biosynthesis monooxygenase family protein [Salinimicrobium sp.]